jgi:hypothetical protein
VVRRSILELEFFGQMRGHNQPVTPITHEVPGDLTASLFRNVGGVEIAEVSETNSPGESSGLCDSTRWIHLSQRWHDRFGRTKP